jgi:hypothetical protein
MGRFRTELLIIYCYGRTFGIKSGRAPALLFQGGTDLDGEELIVDAVAVAQEYRKSKGLAVGEERSRASSA